MNRLNSLTITLMCLAPAIANSQAYRYGNNTSFDSPQFDCDSQTCPLYSCQICPSDDFSEDCYVSSATVNPKTLGNVTTYCRPDISKQGQPITDTTKYRYTPISVCRGDAAHTASNTASCPDPGSGSSEQCVGYVNQVTPPMAEAYNFQGGSSSNYWVLCQNDPTIPWCKDKYISYTEYGQFGQYCGYAVTDKYDDLSCTPFQYKSYAWANTYNNFNTQGTDWSNTNASDALDCNSGAAGDDYLDHLAYTPGETKGYGVWVAGSGTDADPTWEYVFHACDGAGTQPDCAGDIRYVESFVGQGNDPTTSLDKLPGYSTFKHPGTNKTYAAYQKEGDSPGYMAGWQCGNGDVWKDQDCIQSKATGGWDTSSQVEPGNRLLNVIQKQACQSGETHIDILSDPANPRFSEKCIKAPMGTVTQTIMTFPWVCSDSGNDAQKMPLKGNTFSYPTLTASDGYKCYVNNEPSPDGLDETNKTHPEYVELNEFLLVPDSSSNKLNDKLYVLKHIIYNNNSSTGESKPPITKGPTQLGRKRK